MREPEPPPLAPKDPRLERLRALLPEAFPLGSLEPERLAALLGLPRPERFGLGWPGKREALREALRQPRTRPVADRDQSLAFDTARHLLLEGDNLEWLLLMQEAYRGRVKLIYIDPPYNTGNDNFVYADKFSEKKQDYRRRAKAHPGTGDQENGHLHAAWLSMMAPRLALAKNLLQDDGLILISIDDNEQAHLRLLCDELFGQENFVGQFIWHNRTTPNDPGTGFATDHEYVLAYAKAIGQLRFRGLEKDLGHYKNPDHDPRGPWIADNPTAASGNESYKFPIVNPHTGQEYRPPKGRFWAFSPKRVAEWTLSGKLVFPKAPGKNFLLKKYRAELRSRRRPIGSVLQGILTASGTKELKALFQDASPFKYPKPTALLKLLIDQVAGPDDIVLDFFAGSGTTGQAVMDLNVEQGLARRFICVQSRERYQSEDEALNRIYGHVSEVTLARLRKAAERHLAEQGDSALPAVAFRVFRAAPAHPRDTAPSEDALPGLMLKLGLMLHERLEARAVGKHLYHRLGDDLAAALGPLTPELARALLDRPELRRVLCPPRWLEQPEGKQLAEALRAQGRELLSTWP